jgi:two-component system, OmpR family, response regulator
MCNIMLVEDDKDLTLVMREWLECQNNDLDVFHDGSEAYNQMMQSTYDVIILDWGVPGLSGVDICRQYRSAKGTAPILMLTGRGQIVDKMEGLDAGADDYMTKPFSMRELSARLRALTRRSTRAFNVTLKVGRLEMDPGIHMLWKDSVPKELLPKDFAVLEFLMRHPDEIFNAQDILQRVWGVDSVATSDAVRTSIKRLRKKLDDLADESLSIIETVSRVGYRLRVRGS